MSAPAVGETLPPSLADVEVLEASGAPRRLGELVRGATLLVFLRHYGCVHCSRQVDLLARRLPELDDLGVRVILVGSGPPADIAGFTDRQALAGYALTLVTDPSLAAYRAAGMERSLGSVVTPRSLVEELGAFARGYFPKKVSGDVAQLGGAILVDDAGKVAFVHRSRRPGDLADVSDIVGAALRIVAERVAAHGRI